MKELKRVEWFDDRFYKYIEKNGNIRYLPSVTTILSILDKNLAQWRGTLGNVECDRLSEIAKRKGSLIHEYCSQLSTGVELKFDKDKFKQDEWLQLVRWNNWLAEVNPEILAIEKTVVYLAYRFAGTLDLLIRIKEPVKINNGADKIEIPAGVFVLDIKSGKNIYDEHSLQLVAYKQAHENEFPALKIDGTILVHLNAKNKIGIKTIVTTDELILENDFENFLNCLVLFNRKAINIEPKIFDMPDSLKWEQKEIAVENKNGKSFDIVIKETPISKKVRQVKKSKSKTIKKIKEAV